MKHLFVPYDIARQLKEKRFDEPCIVHYEDYLSTGQQTLYPLVNWHNIEGVNPADVKDTICAPLYQQVIDWFREHGIYFQEMITKENLGKYAVIDFKNKSAHGIFELNKAIEEALKLI